MLLRMDRSSVNPHGRAQMVRLTVISQTEEEATLKIEGWVSGAGVGVLEEEGTRLLGETQRLILDLSGVRFMDREGISLLERWSGDRLTLRGASRFLHTLLERHGLASDGAPLS